LSAGTLGLYCRRVLRCQECGCISVDRAMGWLAGIARDPDAETAEPGVAIYCPVCAAREELAPGIATYT
jgi:hypothetical protein